MRDRGGYKPFGSIADLVSPQDRREIGACQECGTGLRPSQTKYRSPCSNVILSRQRSGKRKTAKVPKKCMAKPLKHCACCRKEVPLYRKLCVDCRYTEDRHRSREKGRIARAARKAEGLTQ
jgi:hypothetical protein